MGALDLIIARGFGDQVREVGSAYRTGLQERQAFEAKKVDDAQRASINDFELTAAQQRQATQLQDRARLQGIPQQIAEIDAALQANPNDPEARRRAVELATEMGILTGGRVDAGGLLAAPQSSAPRLGQLNPGDYTPESFALYAQTGDLGVLRRYERPREPAAPPQAPKAPTGYTWRDPNNPAAGVNRLEGMDDRPKVSPKDYALARNKMTQVRLARQQLDDIKSKWEPLKGATAAGPFGLGKIRTPAGAAFDAAVDAIRDTVTGLTRVPGVGAMSDFETRLAVAKFPDRNNYEEVTQQQIEQLEQLINTLEGGYSEILGGSSTDSAPDPLGIR